MIKSHLQKTIMISIFAFLASCNSVKKIVNKEFEPLSVKDQQIRAIQESSQNIDHLKPNIGIHVGKEILIDFLPDEIEKSILQTNALDVKINSFKPSINLTKQAIIIDVVFSASFSEIQTKIDGKLQGYIGISSVNDTIFFLPALKVLKITNIEFTEDKPKLKNRAIAALIKPLAKHFLDNINGILIKEMPRINTGWSAITEINTEELFSNEETTINGPTVGLSRFVKSTSWIVDKKGITVMLELEKTKKRSSVDSTNQTGMITNINNLNIMYKEYQDKFRKLWFNNFQVFNDSTKLSVGVTKSTIAGIFNDVLSTASLDLSHDIKIPKTESKDNLEIDRLDIDCNSVRERFSFPDFHYGSNCDYSCMKTITIGVWPFKTKIRIDDPICGAARIVCKTARETARIAWQTSRETARIAHQIYNEGKIAVCKIAVEASELVNVGIIETSSEGNGVAKMQFSNIVMSNDLSTLQLKMRGNVNLKLKSSLGIFPQDIGFLMCITDYKNNINTDLSGEFIAQFSEINFTSEKKGEDIVLTGRVAPISYKAETDLSPLHALLLDPELALKCPLLYSTLFVGGVVGGTAALLGMVNEPELQLLLKGSAIGSYEVQPFTQKLSPITFKLRAGERYKSKIGWNQFSIDYVY